MKKIVIVLLVFFTTFLYSQNFDLAKNAKNEPKVSKKKKEGLFPHFVISSNFILNDNSSYIGQQEGTVVTFGIVLNGKIDYIMGKHDIKFSIDVSEQFSRTPILERFTKSSDNIKMNLEYLYHISDFWGPFGKASFESSLLPSHYDTVDKATYIKPDGTTKISDSIKLSESLNPMTIKESLGVFFIPFNKKYLNIDIRGGFGALHTIASGAYFVDDNEETVNEVELKEFESFDQAGGSFSLNLKGSIDLKTVVTYEAMFEMLTPVIYDDPKDREAFDLTNYDINVKISTKLTDWLSLSYQLKVLKQPQLLDEWQVQNNFMISLNYLLIGKK